jgi:DNA polymerase IV
LDYLFNQFGTIGQRLYDLSRGVDDRLVNPERIRKSISVEETYVHDLPNVEACFTTLPGLIVRLEARIQRADATSEIHNLFVKLKFNDFQQTTVECVYDHLDATILYQLIHEGFLRKRMPVRLLGIGVKLKQEQIYDGVQLPLFE